MCETTLCPVTCDLTCDLACGSTGAPCKRQGAHEQRLPEQQHQHKLLPVLTWVKLGQTGSNWVAYNSYACMHEDAT
jgi:hypothetical protein